jgi:hypothetical protein
MVENSVPDVDGDYDEESFGNFKWLGRRGKLPTSSLIRLRVY